MIDWNKYFDHIFVISRCINFDRRKYIDEQFLKLGITNYQYWYVPDYDLRHSKVFKYNEKAKIEHQRCTLGHYTLWKTCSELGYNNVLICEDDINFIDDNNIIIKMLNKYKESDSDIYLFDYIQRENYITYSDYTLTTCYSVNKLGLNYLIKYHEKYNSLSDQYFFKFNKEEINELDYYIIHVSISNEYQYDMYFSKEDLNIKLNVSPIKICYQPDKI